MDPTNPPRLDKRPRVTFQRLVDVVVQVVDSEAVFEAGRVFLYPVGHHIDGYVAVVLPHLTQQMSDDSQSVTVYHIETNISKQQNKAFVVLLHLVKYQKPMAVI